MRRLRSAAALAAATALAFTALATPASAAAPAPAASVAVQNEYTMYTSYSDSSWCHYWGGVGVYEHEAWLDYYCLEYYGAWQLWVLYP